MRELCSFTCRDKNIGVVDAAGEIPALFGVDGFYPMEARKFVDAVKHERNSVSAYTCLLVKEARKTFEELKLPSFDDWLCGAGIQWSGVARPVRSMQMDGGRGELCPICRDGECDWELHCTHGFHIQCLAKWGKKGNTCPICREIALF